MCFLLIFVVTIMCYMTDISQIPPEFIVSNLTAYQQKSIEVKYHIKKTVEENEGSKMSSFRGLSHELCLSVGRIRNTEHSIK